MAGDDDKKAGQARWKLIQRENNFQSCRERNPGQETLVAVRRKHLFLVGRIVTPQVAPATTGCNMHGQCGTPRSGTDDGNVLLRIVRCHLVLIYCTFRFLTGQYLLLVEGLEVYRVDKHLREAALADQVVDGLAYVW